jgi:hypothetical protein
MRHIEYLHMSITVCITIAPPDLMSIFDGRREEIAARCQDKEARSRIVRKATTQKRKKMTIAAASKRT